MVITVGLMGNPNVGKTSLFNQLVGARQYVANWPGVTVTKIDGATTYQGNTLHVVDLPGVYTLTAISIDERVTRDYLLYSPPNVTVVVVDSLNPHQGLYLLSEALELDLNVVLVMNSIDEVRKNGTEIDKNVLETAFGVPVIFTSALTGEGVEELKSVIVKTFKTAERSKRLVYREKIENKIIELSNYVPENYSKRFFALKVLEGDVYFQKMLDSDVVRKYFDSETANEIVKTRYDYILQVIETAYIRKQNAQLTETSALDHVLTHKYISIPIFLALVYLTFKFTFDVVAPLSDLIDFLFSTLAEKIGDSNIFSSLISQGIITGVGSVLVFIPSIFALFFILGIMEDSGYLPRIGFVVDRIMYKLKLTGRSFMSLILGFGCNVSTVMASRVLSDERERITTILVSPFISCSARLPVYLMIIGAAFPAFKGEALFGIYTLSILLIALSAKLVNKVFLKGQEIPFVMELPRYKTPSLKAVSVYVWNRGKHFLEKAGGIILVASALVWALSYFPNSGDVENSFVAYIGKGLEFIFKPLDFEWQIVSALIFGGVAKEVIVSSFAQFYGGIENVSFSLSVAVPLLVFVLAYIPCFATLGVIKSETGKWKYVGFAVIYSLTIAYLLAFLAKVLVALVGGLI